MSDTTNQEPVLVQDELATLKARADMLGIQYHPSIGAEKLRAKIAENLAEPVVPADSGLPIPPVAQAPVVVVNTPVVPVVETEGQRRKRLKDAALALVRIRLTCMNPAKKEWDGEIFTVGNSRVGSHTKYVPFNADDGYHVPHILYETLRDRQCQVFYSAKTVRGVEQRKGKLIKEFAIEVLPALTADELKDLAARQAATRAIDA